MTPISQFARHSMGAMSWGQVGGYPAMPPMAMFIYCELGVRRGIPGDAPVLPKRAELGFLEIE